jgi:hypothetical protein
MKGLIENYTDIRIPLLKDSKKYNYYQYILPFPQHWSINLPDNFTSSFLYYSGLLLGSGLLIIGCVFFYSYNVQTDGSLLTSLNDLLNNIYNSSRDIISSSYEVIKNFFTSTDNQADPGQGANPASEEGSGVRTPPANHSAGPDVNDSPVQPRKRSFADVVSGATQGPSRSRSNSDSTVKGDFINPLTKDRAVSPIVDGSLLNNIQGTWTDGPPLNDGSDDDCDEE